MYNAPTELFDVLDDQGNWTGKTKTRAEVHKDGDWHRSFHLWLVKDESYVLFQRRSKQKDLEANKVDVTVGGHFGAGETLAQVVREAEEEIGLRVSPKDLHYLDTFKVERFYEDAVDREFEEVYVMKCNQPLEHYQLSCDEVTVLYEVPIDKAIDLYKNNGFAAANGFDCQYRNNNALLTQEDIILQAKEDTAKTLELIKVWLAN